MIKSRKKRKNRYQESTFGRLKGNFRTLHSFFIISAVFFFVLLLGASFSLIYHKMIDGPWLSLKEIEITGIKKLDRIEVLNAMGLKKGQCTLSINVEQVTEKLQSLPEVRDVSVKLELHGRLMVVITEREPVAIVKCGDQNLEMDPDGFLTSGTASDSIGALPLISGLCGPDSRKGDSVSPLSLERIRDLLAAVRESNSWLSMNAINECRWSENGFTLVLGERAVPVDIGKDAFNQKIAKLRKVINTLNERGWTDLVTHIDLDYQGRAYLEGQFTVPRPVSGPVKQPG